MNEAAGDIDFNVDDQVGSGSRDNAHPDDIQMVRESHIESEENFIITNALTYTNQFLFSQLILMDTITTSLFKFECHYPYLKVLLDNSRIREEREVYLIILPSSLNLGILDTKGKN